jgi:putative molybdopterin biosynthesis protein
MYDLYEVAKMLSVSYMTVYRAVRRGDIKAVKIGKQWRVSEESLESIRKDGVR